MATFIAHIVFGDKVIDSFFPGIDKKAFFIGTAFPDIRYITNKITREQTHKKDVSLSKIQKTKDAFTQGAYFHSLIDGIWRQEYKDSLWRYGEKEDFFLALKLLEDELLYNEIANWETYANYFDKIPYKNCFALDKKTIDTYFAAIREYVLCRPNDDTRTKSLGIIFGFDKKRASKINELVHKIKKDNNVRQNK